MAQDTQKYENTIYGPLWSFFSKMDEIDSIFKTRLYFVSRIIMFKFHGKQSSGTNVISPLCLQMEDNSDNRHIP
jgi:hypothetical protein